MVSAIKKMLTGQSTTPTKAEITRHDFVTIATINDDGFAVYPDGSVGINYDELPDAMEFLRVSELAREHNAAVSRDNAKAATRKRSSKRKKGESLDYNDA